MSLEFIHVAEAKRMIRENISPLAPLKVPLKDATGLVLAEDVFSRTDVPPFNQSSMDGYALNFEGWQTHKRLKIEGVIPAGSAKQLSLDPQNAIRIFTGAAVPPGADTIVIQEKVSVDSGELIVLDTNLTTGLNIRLRGTEIRLGELALEKNSKLTAAACGFLAGLGISDVLVFPRPALSIILTGDELCQPGQQLEYGQVYESNSYALLAALKNIHINNIKVFTAKDNLKTLAEVLRQALASSDAVLLTGGVSVGDYDFVIRAAEINGIEQIFHKIKQKPGKPFYFGKKGDQVIFGLPGNPASVLSCFYEYILPALGKMSNQKTDLIQLNVPSKTPLKKAAGLSHFLKGFYDGVSVMQLSAQESFRLSSFAKANCLILLDEDRTEYSEGEMVEIHLLPSN